MIILEKKNEEEEKRDQEEGQREQIVKGCELGGLNDCCGEQQENSETRLT